MLIKDHTFINFGLAVHPTCLLRPTWLFGTPEYPKLVRLLHKNHHAKRKILYLVNKSSGEPAKIGHFQFKKSIFEARN